jgi:ADP-L-glycero-D-manno-heptose 6-epimerase
MSKYIVVTGAAGFIGRNLVAALNARGQTDLLLVDHLGQEEKWRNLLGLRYEDLLSPADFLAKLDQGLFDGKLAGFLHLGACSATTEKNADYLLENNYRYTRTLCLWALAQQARFVYASSAATYGDGTQGYSDDDLVTPLLRPLNIYGYSKHLFDLWALKHSHFQTIAGLKYFNVFGPYEEHKAEMRSVVQKAYHQILAQGSVDLFKSYRPEYPDGGQQRDFVYLRDAVAVTLHLYDHPQRNGLFNCGTGQARSWLDLAQALFTAMQRPPAIHFIDMPASLRPNYQYFTQADLTKLRGQGAYLAPFLSLEEAVQDYVQSHLEQRTSTHKPTEIK